MHQLLCSDSILCKWPLHKDMLASCDARPSRVVMLVHPDTAHDQVDIRVRGKLFG